MHALIPQPQSTTEAVQLTLAYFNAIGLPLTAFEIHHKLINFKASYGEVLEVLQDQPLASQVISENGFYSLRDLDHIDSRFTRNKISEFK